MKSNESAAAATADQAKSGKKKSAIPELQFSELDDLFLSQKGKKLRNLQKKFDKIKEQEKLVKKGEIKPNEDMLAKLATKNGLKAEIKELKDLCDLYMKSNPNFNKKEKVAAITQIDVCKAIGKALTRVSRVLTLADMINQDSSVVEASEQQIASIKAMAASVSASDFQQTEDSELLTRFASLAHDSDKLVCEDGVSYKELGALLTTQFTETTERSQTIQRLVARAAADKPAESQDQTTTDAGDAAPAAVADADEAEKVDDTPEPKTDDAKVEEGAGDEKKQEAAKDGETKQERNFGADDGQVRRERGGRGRGERRNRGDRGGRGRGRGGKTDPDDDFIEETG